MRTFGTILALLLIFFGLVVAGLVVVRIWQDDGLVRLDINTANVVAPTATVPVSDPVRGRRAPTCSGPRDAPSATPGPDSSGPAWASSPRWAERLSGQGHGGRG